TVAPTTLALEPGEKAVVTATLAGHSITQGATWRSSDTTVASVSANGVVTAISEGTADITATHPAATGPGTVEGTDATPRGHKPNAPHTRLGLRGGAVCYTVMDISERFETGGKNGRQHRAGSHREGR